MLPLAPGGAVMPQSRISVVAETHRPMGDAGRAPHAARLTGGSLYLRRWMTRTVRETTL